MGAQASRPEQFVLVPPLFERQHVDVERFTRLPFSPDSDLFRKRQLGRLFEDYLVSGFSAEAVLSSKQSPHSTIIARFQNPQPEDGFGDLNGRGVFRFQPRPRSVPYTFGQLAIDTGQGEANLSGCWKVPQCNAFLSASHPISKASNFQDTRLGVAYSTSNLLVGGETRPLRDALPTDCYVAFGRQDLKAAVQCRADLSGAAGKIAPSWTYGVFYSPGGSDDATRGSMCTAVEVHDGRELELRVEQRMVVRRRVKNPLEDAGAVGITNVIDAGFVVKTPLGGSTAEQSMKMALQWQVNKNVCIKGSASLDDVAGSLAFKSWWDPCVTVAVSSRFNYRTKVGGLGFTLNVENIGRTLFARAAKEGFTIQTQESAASQHEVQEGLGERPTYEDGAGRGPREVEGHGML